MTNIGLFKYNFVKVFFFYFNPHWEHCHCSVTEDWLEEGFVRDLIGVTQRCNGNTAGLGYKQVVWVVHVNHHLGKLAVAALSIPIVNTHSTLSQLTLKGQCHEIFDDRFISLISFVQAPE